MKTNNRFWGKLERSTVFTYVANAISCPVYSPVILRLILKSSHGEHLATTDGKILVQLKLCYFCNNLELNYIPIF